MKTSLTPAAQELTSYVFKHLTHERPNLSLFETLQAMGAVSLTIIDRVLSRAQTLTPEERQAAQTEADEMAERILAHMDAVRLAKKTPPVVDMITAANLLAHLGVHYESQKVRVLASQTAPAPDAATEQPETIAGNAS